MPKLPKGMFRRKGRPGWYTRVYRGGRERLVSLGSDFGLAQRKLRGIQSGTLAIGESRITVRQAATRWLESCIKTQRNEKGQTLSAQRVRDSLDPFMGHRLLEKVGGEDVRAYRLWLERQGRLSLASVGHVLADCRCMLRWAEDSGLIERCLFPRRVMPRLQERPPDRLTDEQAEALRVLSEPYGFVCRLALGTGLRWGELTRAQASDVERGFLVVHHTKSRRVRRVPLSPELLGEVRMRVGRLVPFARVSPGSFSARVRKLAGLDGFHVHQMRHTFACQWLERGGSLAALQQILGHASIETTQRYARLTDEVVMREAERIRR
jgi:integrase